MKKIIIDFDSTLVKVEALDKLAERSLARNRDKEIVIKEIKKITEMGMNGEISFPESLQKRIRLIQTNRNVIAEVANLIKEEISDSVLKNLKFFKENNADIFIISGGFKDLILPTAEILGIHFENILANNFVFSERGNLIGIDENNLMAQENGKVNQLKLLNLKGELIMVGDGWTDYQTKEAGVADHFIAYTENVYREKVVSRADGSADNFKKVIDYFNSQS